jgi:putative DNA primase/helicase
MDRIMAGNKAMITYLQRIAGLSFTADVSVQELYICHGEGANGKNVFWDTLIGMGGDYAGTAADSLLTNNGHGEHPTEKADLQGKRLIVANETEEGAKLRVSLVKQLTGNLTIKARYMRCDYFEFPRSHKLILVTNNKPTIGETTHAIWRRVRLIPFTVIIPEAERDEHLLGKLRAEWSGILNWCIQGFADFQARGMQTPSEVQLATKGYRDTQDVLAGYISERCVCEPNAYVRRDELHEDYLSWAKSDRHGQKDRNAFYGCVRRLPGITDTQKRIDNIPARVFIGIGLANLSARYRQATEKLENADTVAP